MRETAKQFASAFAPPAPATATKPDTAFAEINTGTAHLLPRLTRGRQAGPVFLSERRPAPPAAPQPGTCARPPDGTGSVMTAPGSCSPGTPGGNSTSSATPQRPISASKASRCS
jgi:hypothetical protein